MDDGVRRAKEPVSAAIAGPYGHPFHPILVTVPIGAWVSSLVFDVGSRVVSDGRYLVQGSQWLIAIGVLGALAAGTVGALDLLAIPPRTRAFRTGLVHMTLNLTITATYVVNFLLRSGDDADSVPTGVLVLSIVALAALGVSGFLGGMLAYRFGVRVADEATQAEGYRSAHSTRKE